MSWVSDCAERWVGQGNLEEEAINGAITETLVRVLQLCDTAKGVAKTQDNFVGELAEKMFDMFADSVRMLMVNPNNTPPANDG